MRTATLRQSGGSVIVSLPKSMLEQLGLVPNQPVEIDIEGDKIVIRRRRKGRVGLAARLALCDAAASISDKARSTIDLLEAAPPVGREWGSAEWLAEEERADPDWVKTISDLYDEAG